MKKSVSLVMAIVFVICMAAMAGCSSGPVDVSGTTWVVSGGSEDGTKVAKEDLETLFGGEMLYVFEKDGKLNATIGTQSTQGTWKQDGNKVSVTLGTQTSEMTMDGNKMLLKNGAVQVEFTKK